MVKRLASVDLDEGQRNLVEVIPLGAGQEVGRSCIILRYMCAGLPPPLPSKAAHAHTPSSCTDCTNIRHACKSKAVVRH
jgi:hypothetical protein